MNAPKQIQFTMKIVFIVIWISSLQLLGGAYSVNAENDDDTHLSEEFIMQQDSSRWYLTDLEINETWSLNCTAKYQGIFYLYLYNARPTSVNYLTESTNYPELGETLVTYNETPSEVFSTKLNDTIHTITLEYNASEDALYYLEILLVENGPDTFVLKSEINGKFNEIQAYYIPFIPGYPIIFIITGTSLTLIILKKKIKQKIAKKQ